MFYWTEVKLITAFLNPYVISSITNQILINFPTISVESLDNLLVNSHFKGHNEGEINFAVEHRVVQI